VLHHDEFFASGSDFHRSKGKIQNSMKGLLSKTGESQRTPRAVAPLKEGEGTGEITRQNSNKRALI